MKIRKIGNNKHIIYINKGLNTQSKNYLRKAIFFDRDGVIIKDVNYIKNEKDVSLLKGITDLLRYSCDIGYLNIIITNQSGISRKYFSWGDYEKVTIKMLEKINLPNAISAIYANGELPNDLSNKISWRKPNPNMILEAAKDFNLDLSKSTLIGDRLSDIKSGEKAGIRNYFHVLTGHGKKEREKVMQNYSMQNDFFKLKLINDLTSIKRDDI